ncbi:zinc-binding dehydrogenase [Streptomyces sp. NPDC001139]
MKAVYADHPCMNDPLSALVFAERPDPVVPDDNWTLVKVQAAALNHHDLWNLKGAGPPANKFPLILGCEGSGADASGREVIIWGMVCAPKWLHDPVRDKNRTLLSDEHPGTFAEWVAVPKASLCEKPPEFSHEEASCLSATWLTAYRMLFTKSGLRPGDTVLIQGAGGGVSTALIRLARAGGFRTWVTGRTEAKRDAALQMGADAVFQSGRSLPEPVDAVMESVGAATWSHSIRSVRPGGTIVVTGATTGGAPPAYLNRIFWQELRIVGSTSGTLDELRALTRFMVANGLRPDICARLPFADAAQGFHLLLSGHVVGKVVFTW